TYYASSSDKKEWLFAINKNGNNFNASVDIDKYPGTIASIHSQNAHAAFIVGRTWNVNIISGTIDPLLPVAIRFYLDTNEINDARMEAETFANANSLSVGSLEFFKHPNQAFDPYTQVYDGNNFNFNKVSLNAIAGIQNKVSF